MALLDRYKVVVPFEMPLEGGKTQRSFTVVNLAERKDPEKNEVLARGSDIGYFVALKMSGSRPTSLILFEPVPGSTNTFRLVERSTRGGRKVLYRVKLPSDSYGAWGYHPGTQRLVLLGGANDPPVIASRKGLDVLPPVGSRPKGVRLDKAAFVQGRLLVSYTYTDGSRTLEFDPGKRNWKDLGDYALAGSSASKHLHILAERGYKPWLIKG